MSITGVTNAIPARLPASSAWQDEAVQELAIISHGLPQIELPTKHLFAAGLYARTVTVPKGHFITGAFIKIPTVLILNGECSVTTNDGLKRITGYHVIAAEAGRRQAYIAHEDTTITMLFATRATSVEAVEAEFTDEHDQLLSRQNVNEVVHGS